MLARRREGSPGAGQPPKPKGCQGPLSACASRPGGEGKAGTEERLWFRRASWGKDVTPGVGPPRARGCMHPPARAAGTWGAPQKGDSCPSLACWAPLWEPPCQLGPTGGSAELRAGTCTTPKAEVTANLVPGLPAPPQAQCGHERDGGSRSWCPERGQGHTPTLGNGLRTQEGGRGPGSMHLQSPHARALLSAPTSPGQQPAAEELSGGCGGHWALSRLHGAALAGKYPVLIASTGTAAGRRCSCRKGAARAHPQQTPCGCCPGP